MGITYDKVLEHLYYNCLPEVYRVEDLKQKPKLPLYRYLQSVAESAFKESLSDIEGLMFLVDPKDCPEVFLPYLLKCFGFDYFEDIDPKYQRKLIASIGELVKRKGTCSGVKYLARVLTGLDARLYLTDYEGRKVLTVELLFDTLSQVDNLDNDIKSVERYIEYFVPFWVLPVTVTSSIRVQELKDTNYSGSAITQFVSYDLVPKGVV